ncbi:MULTISPECIES: hypothetical protein [unclassified Microcoleus]|uniref:hypothetical protein n=1 Tax=unclassified Microcoleus TaxID=2642155 RepID=UPI002FD69647
MNQGFWIRNTLKSCVLRLFFALSWRSVAPPQSAAIVNEAIAAIAIFPTTIAIWYAQEPDLHLC